MTAPRTTSVFAGFRFPQEVISLAVRRYLRYGLSYRDVEQLLAERGTTVDHVTIYRWVQRFTPEFIEAARACRHAPGDRWFVDETYLKVAGQWTYLYRAVDQHGQVIDVLLSARRDLAAARRFFHVPVLFPAGQPRSGPTLSVRPINLPEHHWPAESPIVTLAKSILSLYNLFTIELGLAGSQTCCGLDRGIRRGRSRSPR